MRKRGWKSLGAAVLATFAAAGPAQDAGPDLYSQCVPTPMVTGDTNLLDRQRREVERLEKSGADELVLVDALAGLADAYFDLGEYNRTEEILRRIVDIRERRGRTSDAQYVRFLEQLAIRERVAGKPVLAETTYKRCMDAARRVLGPESVQYGNCLEALGVLYLDLGRYGEAQAALTRAVDILESTKGAERSLLGGALGDLAVLYKYLGNYARAEALFKRSLALREEVHGPCHESVATTLGNLGRFYRETGRPDLALPYDRRGLEVRIRTRGPDGYTTAFSHNYLGLTLSELGQHAEGEAHVLKSLEIREKTFGFDHRDTLVSAWYLVQIRQRTNRLAEAEQLIQQALRSNAIQRSPELRWRFQNAYRALLQAKGMSSAAAYFGKEAVNTIQSMRAQLTRLERDLQQSFLRERTTAYRELADLLIGQGRLPEAQQVLAMLKEEEYFDFIQRDGKEDSRTTRPAFTAAEQPWEKRHGEISGRLASLGVRRGELDRKRGAGLSVAEEAELKQIEASMQTARAEFVVFIDELIKDMSRLDGERRASADRQRRDVEGMAKYQRHLNRLGPGTVMLHYVVLPDKVRVILSTHNNQIGYASAIDEKALNQKIQEFRDTLQYPREDPRIAGAELYRILIAPLARDLQQLQARTLILSLDGALRYVPFAALHDGNRYLIQDYQLALVTEAADIRVTAEASRQGSFAGLGLTQQVPGFDPLPAVKAELEGILQGGRIKGDIYLDKAFTAERVRQTLRQDVSLLHIASHFVFRPGTESDSYLLLGDGGKLSLRDLRIADYDFQDVELLTLSACDTATGGGSDANGREVEGLGVLAQQKGARAVMATLWPVADASTGMLMQNFYRLRAERSGVTKADALRQAQLALLTGQHGQVATPSGPGGEQRGAGRADRAPRYKPDPKAPYAHPYFWAPFILMGNWL